MSDGALKFQPVFTDKTYTYHFYESDNWRVFKFGVVEDYAFSVVRDNYGAKIGVVCHSLRKYDWQWLDVTGQKVRSLTVGKVGQLPAAKAVVDGRAHVCNVMDGDRKENLPYTVTSDSQFSPLKELAISVRKPTTPFTAKGEKLLTQHATQFNNRYYLVQLWEVGSGGYKIRRPILKPVTKEVR